MDVVRNFTYTKEAVELCTECQGAGSTWSLAYSAEANMSIPTLRPCPYCKGSGRRKVTTITEPFVVPTDPNEEEEPSE